MTDYKALCAELANYLQGRKDLEYGWPGEDPEQDLLDRARAALAQPEPQGVTEPTDEELESFLVDVACQNGNMYHADPMILARAVLAHYARPTIKPVPVAERPWEREGWCDEEGICWWWRPDTPEGNAAWIPATTALVDELVGVGFFAYSLPHHALPLPQSH